jgi:8-oxo-dGTP pyrophosphatase MutT (NUDIX family)
MARDWVNVVCETVSGELVLVRQWRFGVRAFTLELPAGLLEDGEDAVDGGLRELLEETGFAPRARGDVQVLGHCAPNAAFMNNRCTTVYVPSARRVADQALDEMEEVEVVLLPRAQLDVAIERGELSTALGLAGLFLWQRGLSNDSTR